MLPILKIEKPVFYYKKIVNNKNLDTRNVLLNLGWKIPFSFVNYHKLSQQNILNTIESSLYLSEPEKSALISCYSDSKYLKELKLKIIESRLIETKELCPYCTINEYNTFDHYLPKENFPEFSAFSHNLIPCCSKCNSHKGVFYGNNESRFFIHFFYDYFLNYQFLRCRIQFRNGIPKTNYYLEKPDEISNSDFNVIQEHFRRLDLLNRFDKLANSDISEVRISFERNYTVGKRNEISTFLLNESIGLKDRYGVNYRKKVLKESLANCEDFINNLNLLD